VEVEEPELLLDTPPPVLDPLLVVAPVEPVPLVPLPEVLELETPLLLTPLEEAPVLPESDGFPLPEELLAREATGMFWSMQPATSAATTRGAYTSLQPCTASILHIPSAPPPNVQSIIP
jgi:hypothetical protein